MLRWLRKFGWLFTAAGRAEIKALFIALRDSRAPFAARGLALLALLYVVWPFDLVPDVIPVLGWLDDLTIGPLLLWAAAKLIPGEVMASARAAVLRRAQRS
ncbi:MAG: DUF1232 domain-containing protein [Betaproteobacteria bacterium]